MPIIRSSRVLYKWLLPVVVGAWFSSCRYGVELRVVFGLRAAGESAIENIDMGLRVARIIATKNPTKILLKYLT